MLSGKLKSHRKGIKLLLVAWFIPLAVFLQTDSTKRKSYSFEAQLFSNIWFSVPKTDNAIGDFNVKRTLLIYRQQLPQNFGLCLAADSYVNESDKQWDRSIYIKRAYLQYKQKQFSVSTGLLVLEQFKLQRKIWGLRYIDKTFQNKFGYGDNRNTGVLIKHQPNTLFSYDVAYTMGYVTPHAEFMEENKLMVGNTFYLNKWKLRHFHSLVFDNSGERVHSLFVTSDFRKVSFGAESAVMFNKNNVEDEDKLGFSVFGNVEIVPKLKAFSRFDLNADLNNLSADETLLWIGSEYQCVKWFRFSVYYRNADFDSGFIGLGMFFHYR